MVDTNVTPLESPSLEKVRELVQFGGPCVTVELPPYHPGEPSRSSDVVLRGLLKDAGRELEARGIPEDVRKELIAPLAEFSEEPAMLKGSRWGRIIFRCPGVLRQFSAGVAQVAVSIGGTFQIRKVLSELQIPTQFHVLHLTKKEVTLYGCSNLEVKRLHLPKGVPATLDEYLGFKAPDHDLENRSSAGPSVGSMRGVLFGTGSAREMQHGYLSDFYKKLDRGLAGFLRPTDTPLLLAGVEEDTNLYRAVNTYPELVLESLPAQPLEDQALLSEAHKILRAAAMERHTKDLLESKERIAAPRYCTDLTTILVAAVDGRVDRLYIDDTTHITGVFDSIMTKYRSFGDEDLLNLAMVQTIRHGGEVFSLGAGRIPDRASAAAVLRY